MNNIDRIADLQWPSHEDELSHGEAIELHERLIGIAAQRGALDVEEARLLRVVDHFETWRVYACVNQLDYMERVLGYRPHTAGERIRVARALRTLPKLEAAMSTGELCFTAVRELTRVALDTTENAWGEAARGKTIRQIEEMVSGRAPGDLPTDPPKPEYIIKRVSFELAPETVALIRQLRTMLADEHGHRLDDNEFVEAICNAALEASSPGEPGRAKYEIGVRVCERCKDASVEGGGAQLPIHPETLARMECDSNDIGHLDAVEPERATQAVPPASYRLVWARDGGRCKVPGCRSARGLEVHHRVPRSEGGSNELLNLILLCSACHQNLHSRFLDLYGPPEDLRADRPLAFRGPYGEPKVKWSERLQFVPRGTRTRAPKPTKLPIR